MSELTNTHQTATGLKKYLLTTASAFALAIYVSSNDVANAQDSDRPTVWIELGGQMESVQGTYTPFTAPFMTALSPTPGPYTNDIFAAAQRPARLAFGLQGAATFQPRGSDWQFSISLRYGRSSTNRLTTKATLVSTLVWAKMSGWAHLDTKACPRSVQGFASRNSPIHLIRQIEEGPSFISERRAIAMRPRSTITPCLRKPRAVFAGWDRPFPGMHRPRFWEAKKKEGFLSIGD